MSKILIEKSTVKQALDALENNTGEYRVEGAKNILQSALAAPQPAAQPEQEPAAQSGAVPMWHKAGCADWYFGYPDHEDGGGPYESRTFYVDPQPAQPEPPTWSAEQWKLLHFLYGAGEFDGVWFEQPHPIEEGAFWWRTHLRRLFGDAPRPAQPAVTGWPCEIVQADFQENTLTLEMKTADFRIAAGTYWLCSAPQTDHFRGVTKMMQPAQPLTDEQIMHEYMVCDGLQIDSEFKSLVKFARAIEAAHGIKEQP